MALFQSLRQVFQAGLRLIDGTDLNNALANIANSVSSGLVATGATFATALQMTSAINQFATVAANTGGILPPMLPGQQCEVYNDGASALTVYATGSTIDGTAGATGVALTNAKRCIYTQINLTAIESAQLGVTSA